MKSVTTSLILLLAFACLAQDKPAESKPPQNITLADLQFISGHSRGTLDGGIIDELWSEPAGDSMMGVYRYIKGGKVEMYEFMAIQQTANGPVLLLKHFNPGLEGREEKAKVWTYPLIRWSGGEAVFESPDKGTRIGYRVTGKGVLEATLEHTGQKTEVFRYTHTPD